VLNDDRSVLVPAPERIGGSSTRFGLIAHEIAWGFLLVLLAFVVPRVEANFIDYGIALPQVTSLVIWASHQVVAFTSLALVVLVVDGLMRNTSERGGSGLSRAWSVLMLVSPLAWIALTLLALALPFFTIDPHFSG
jgi:type II secretory pathway component PulF